MPFTLKNFGHYVTRRDYSKIFNHFPLPNLIDIQLKNYQWFIDHGIQEIFDDIFPIVSPDNKRLLSLLGWEIREPRTTIVKAKEEAHSYEVPLYALLGLTIDESNYTIRIESNPNRKDLDIIKSWLLTELKFKKLKLLSSKNSDSFYFVDHRKDKAKHNNEIEVRVKSRTPNALIVDFTLTRQGEVFFGDFPLMTDKGTFVINGSEKVVVSQLIRSPGAHYKSMIDVKTGLTAYYSDLIPARGTWLEFESLIRREKKTVSKHEKYVHQIKIKIDKSRKLAATTLFTALGFEKAALLKLYKHHPLLLSTYSQDANDTWSEAIQEIYKKIRAGETATSDGAFKFLVSLLFNSRKYDLTKPGRFKLNQKLTVADRLYNRILAEDLIDINGNVVLPEKTLITADNFEMVQQVLAAGAHQVELTFAENIPGPRTVQRILVFVDNDKQKDAVPVIGIVPGSTSKTVTVPDIVAAFGYLLNLTYQIGHNDDIDNLGNRRVRTVGELLQNQFRIGMARIEKNVREKMSTIDLNRMRPITIINNKPLTAAIGEFFNLSQLSQFMDQTNPLSELTNKRRLTALGPGGLSRERAGLDVRDVHSSHYGRICPIETPEGPNVGLINNLATYAKINQYGFIETPYRKCKKGYLLDDYEYLSADQEARYVIGQANVKVKDGKLVPGEVMARHDNENIVTNSNELNYIDVSPKQIVSVAAALIPFLENDDASRALMGANMQRQAVPLLIPESPIVGTGMEHKAAKDSGLALVAEADGVVKFVDGQEIIIKHKNGVKTYTLSVFDKTNQGTVINHHSLVKVGDKIEAGQVIADGPAMQKGELALGRNAVVAFTTWNGYNYEDAIIISERLVQEDAYTSIHIEEYILERRQTKQGPEEITREIPNIPDSSRRYLDEDGLVMVGVKVKEGDILVGKVTPKGQTQSSPEDKLLQAIFGEKSRSVRDNSLRVPTGGGGVVQAIKRYSRAEGYDLPSEVLEVVKVYIVQKRKIQSGDKMSGRHGNKGVISRVLPVEDMPYLEDGTPVDIMLNPLGIPSRMNIGQILELHVGMAAKKLNVKVASPVFEGLNQAELDAIMNEAGMTNYGKVKLIDGQTGEAFAENICVGVMYMLKLSHMVDDKIHARNVGPYSLITQQPLGGKAQNGGQRFGEMEVWALEAYGAAHILQEILTIKSDDIKGRTKAYEAIIRNRPLPQPGIPESFNVLTRELQGLGIDIKLYDAEGKEKSVSDYYQQQAENDEDAIFAGGGFGAAMTAESAAVVKEPTADERDDNLDDDKEALTNDQ